MKSMTTTNLLEVGVIEVKKATHLNKYFLPSAGDVFEVEQKDDRITIKSGAPQCVFCGRLGTVEHYNKTVCKNCIQQMQKLFEGSR